MGSHGAGWHNCEYCDRKGVNQGPIPQGTTILYDVDGVGLLCDPCHDRGWPPHFDYLRELLKGTTIDESAMHTIAMYAYPKYDYWTNSEYWMGFYEAMSAQIETST